MPTKGKSTRMKFLPLRKASALTSILPFYLIASLLLASCGQSSTPSYDKGTHKIKVLAAETFLADITRNITGDRADVISLIPIGMDPHSFEPTPKDVALIDTSDLFIINGSGFEAWLQPVMKDLPDNLKLVEASSGLIPRQPAKSEIVDEEIDPHFWLDPSRVIRYVQNIREAMVLADPGGEDIYTKNADSYVAKLRDLDAWVKTQIETIPADRRIMVTNHESFGYYADRYGLKIVGTILPGVTTDVSPSAKQMADLVNLIKANHVPAIFLEVGTNPELADQLASETNVKVITNIYSHSITDPDGKAPTYLDMIRVNTEMIAKALKNENGS
jgi:ABC-type Zn uptake system ZnuABC Zn-binding protein ZnuA